MKIKTLDIDTYRMRRRTNVEDIPEEIPQVKPKGRRYTARKSGGIKTQRTMSQYLEMLFIRNELEALRGKPLTRAQLQHNLALEFPHRRLDHLIEHRKSFGTYQREFNLGKLYAAQSRPIMVAFRYDEEGFIVESSNASKYINFERCRAICAEYRIADPRFFTFKELTELRRRFSLREDPVIYWSIATVEEVKTIHQKTEKPCYNALRFPKGLGLQEALD